MKKGILILIALLSFESYSQDYKKSYKSFSSFGEEHIIEFINDSIIEVRNIPRHIGILYSVRTKYLQFSDTISFLFDKRVLNTENLKRVGLNFLINYRSILIKNNDEWFDETHKIIYVPLKKYYKKKYYNRHITIVDGKKYISSGDKTNGKGGMIKKGKLSRGLKEVIKNLQKDSAYYIINKLDLFESYKKYGVLGLNGVTEYNTRSKTKIN